MATELATKLAELEPDVSWLFGCIASRDINERSQALVQLETWVNEVITLCQEDEEEDDQNDISDRAEERQAVILRILLQVLRLSIQCPFNEVKLKCSDLLQSAKDKGIQIPRQCGRGPSAFIPTEELIPASNGPEELDLKEMLTDVFIQNQRINHLTGVLGLHPRYLKASQETQEFMMKKDGPLPFEYRHYLAIMAASRHHCTYLVKLQENEFCNLGGNPAWLESIDNIPVKLQNLYQLIKYLAHQPWLIDMNMIETLLQPPNSWSLSELVQAVVIVSHFCALPCLVYGCGVNLEVDMEGGYTMSQSEDISPSMTNNNHTPEEIEGASADVETLMKRMRELTEQSEAEDSQEEHIKEFEKVERQNLELVPKGGDEHKCTVEADLSMYLRDPDFIYKDFARRGETSRIPTFRVQDYSWEEHGFSLVNRYYPDIATLIDNRLSLASNMTYNTMGRMKGVDTSLLRRAIWNYVHVLFGIRHDDYDYSEVNHLLDRSLKSYIKLVACFPERITHKDYSRSWKDFTHSDKVHATLMVLEARMQAGLLYVLKAIMEYMK